MFFKCIINNLKILDFYIVDEALDWSNIRSAMQSEICNRGSELLVHWGKRQSGFWFIGEFVIGLLAYRGYWNRALGLSGTLLSGFWFVGDFVIGLLTYRGFVIGLMVIGLLVIGLMSYTRYCTYRPAGWKRWVFNWDLKTCILSVQCFSSWPGVYSMKTAQRPRWNEDRRS